LFVGSCLAALAVATALLAPVLAPYDPLTYHPNNTLEAPSHTFLLGTDNLGRDTLSQDIYGTRISLLVGVAAVLLGIAGGVPWGLASGFLGGRVDYFMMRMADLVLVFPSLVLALVIRAFLGSSLLNVIIALGVTIMPALARVTRGEVLSIRERDFVTAAVAVGARNMRILVRHVVPNILDLVVVIGTVSLGGAILTEASLSFLGFGTPPPAPSWGRRLREGYWYLLASDRPDGLRVLTVNTGSSSLKAALYLMGQEEKALFSAQAERIGGAGSRFRAVDEDGRILADDQTALPDHGAALQALFTTLGRQDLAPEAIGHRVVHGGAAHREPAPITPDLVAALEELVPIDPDHLPQAIQAIRAVGRAFPALPQIACFDTAFHRRMPLRAQRYALPRRLAEIGVVRYGFHGLSYEYIIGELRRLAPAEAAGRVIIAHLGNGASMVALRGGASLDTTMGFTPAGGLVMGTRSGDLDPGVLLYLLQEQGMTPAALNTMVNQQAGLVGVSGTTGDMRDLLEREAADPHAAEAIGLFCYQARKFLGALAAALGGLDTLVFTAGIGEHAAPVRARICESLEFLGVRLDDGRNAAHAPVISRDGSPVTVRVMKTDEDLMIARHARRMIGR